jgi:ComF family protein
MGYEGQVREALLRFKFQDQPGYATELGRLLAKTIRRELGGQYDLISWVPVSPKRLKKRGYDQAMLLGMAVALELGDVAVETLKKSRENPAQSSLESAKARQGNVLGVYTVKDPELVQGKRILLIDDIITTGATLDEASRTLLRAGAEEVVCAALAHPTKSNKQTKEEST